MSRPWIVGIICCLLFAGSTAVGWGQEYLDLPDEPGGQPTSLADRLYSLKDKFRRKPQQPSQPTTSASNRSRPVAPRYRKTAQASLQAQQRARRLSNQQLNAEQPAPPAQKRTQPRQSKNVQSPGIVARPNGRDLLPDAKLFSRSNQPRPRNQEASKPLPQTPAPKVDRLTSAKTLPRAGSVKAKSTTPRVARLSPATSRANELDAALADLLKTQPATINKAKPTAPLLKPSPKTPVKSLAAAADNTFDLREALREDEADSIAKEAAEAVEDAIQEKADTQEVAKTTTPPKVSAVEKKVAQTPIAEAIKSAPSVPPQPVEPAVIEPVVEEPIVVATPATTPKRVETPPVDVSPKIVEAPAQTQEIEREAVVIAGTPKPVITIATPRPSPKNTSSTTRNMGHDPFESAASQSFSSTPASSNPMRPFQPAIVQEQPKQSFAAPKSGVLQTTQQPVIVSRVEGPRSILVGREATYQVTLENTGSRAASQIAAQITVPEWAELLDAMSTSGVVERSTNNTSTGALEWKISELPPRSTQTLRIRLIPRSGRPLQLGVRWSQAPMQTQAVVEVQEPKLDLAISGPQEVLFGKPQRYRLTLSNPGTGTTERVALRLVPPGGDPQSATTQSIGSLKPGEVRDIDLELTAREAGELLIQADASADGGLTTETTKTVLCRKPELKVDWRGPDKKYAGTVAAYYFRVSNPGTAATEPVDMSIKLPIGAEFVSASEGFSIDTSTGVVNWSLASLNAGEEQFMQVRCKIVRPGTNDFLLSAKTSDDDLNDSKAFQTDVVALADLKLEVSDPQGPLPIGESVVYEIRVRNRGTTGAENINIVGLFSEGIDPTTVEGAQYAVRDGRVSFHPIKSLPAGREVLLRINAKANKVGTHIFRTEVTCPKLDIKLAAEETTRFFEDEHRWENGQTPYMAERETTKQR